MLESWIVNHAKQPRLYCVHLSTLRLRLKVKDEIWYRLSNLNCAVLNNIQMIVEAIRIVRVVKHHRQTVTWFVVLHQEIPKNVVYGKTPVEEETCNQK